MSTEAEKEKAMFTAMSSANQVNKTLHNKVGQLQDRVDILLKENETYRKALIEIFLCGGAVVTPYDHNGVRGVSEWNASSVESKIAKEALRQGAGV